jgi:hypothetical protein
LENRKIVFTFAEIMGIKKKDIEREYRKFFCGWLPKVVERGQVALININNQTNITDNDWEVLEFFYRNYHNGHLSCFMPEVGSPLAQNMTSVSQIGLFADNVAENIPLATIGTEVEPAKETKN